MAEETKKEVKTQVKEEAKKKRKIGEVFSDYKTNSNIADAEITKMNLIKKINTLEIGMYSKEYIEIKEIWYFEKFLRDRFQFGQVHMILQYEELKERNTALQATVDSQAARVGALEKQLAQLRADYDSLKLARMVTITDGDMETAQKRVARLIRQVDKCITLLGESDK